MTAPKNYPLHPLVGPATLVSKRSICILNEKSEITWINPAFTDLWGFRLEELQGRRPTDICGLGDNSAWAGVANLQASHEHFQTEGTLQAKDGQGYQVEIHWLLMETAPEDRHWIGEITDLTKLKERIQSLREKTNTLNAFLNSTTDTNFLLGPGPDYPVLEYNQVAAATIKALFKRELKVGDSFLDYTVPDLQAKFKEDMATALGGKQVSEERKVAYEEGNEVYWQATYQPAYEEDGSIMGVAFNVTNIDAQRKYELALEEKNRRLEEISHLQSHEIRRPVASILGLLNLLNPNRFDEENKAIVTLMQNAIMEMDEVVHRVMELTYDYEKILPFNPSAPDGKGASEDKP